MSARPLSWAAAGAVATMLAGYASAHGNVTSPPARLPGPAMVAACGQKAVGAVLADGTTPLEDVIGALPSCKLDLCRGAMFADNMGRVQTYSAGQTIPFTAIIPIPHEGPMNVSVIDTAANRAISQPLISFASYADEKLAQLPPNNTAFSVSMPTNLPAGKCLVAGECVLQWFWFGTKAKQTYESCVDFVLSNKGSVGGSSGSGGSSGGSGSSSGGSGSGSSGSGSSIGTFGSSPSTYATPVSSPSNTFASSPSSPSNIVTTSSSPGLSRGDAQFALVAAFTAFMLLYIPALGQLAI